MEAKQQLELTIRTAQTVKAFSNLIGVEDATVARLMFLECIQQVSQLKTFVDGLQSAQRRGSDHG